VRRSVFRIRRCILGTNATNSVALRLAAKSSEQAVMLPSWLFGFLLGFSLSVAVNVTLQLLQ